MREHGSTRFNNSIRVSTRGRSHPMRRLQKVSSLRASDLNFRSSDWAGLSRAARLFHLTPLFINRVRIRVFRRSPESNHYSFLLEYLYRIPVNEIPKMSQSFANNINSFNLSTIINCVLGDGSGIGAWLSPLDPRVRHQDIRSQRMDSVGTWLLETREFKSWYGGGGEDESSHATLFCDGNPGVGKSYIR